MRKLTTALFILITAINAQSQTIIIDGTALLENQSIHSDIIVHLQRSIPTPLTYDLLTDSFGYYNSEIEQGIYEIIFSKEGYISYSWTDQLLYSNTSFDTVVLEEIGMFGELSGVLHAGIYNIGGDVLIPYGDTLELEPGVELRFHNNVKFEIFGKLLASGNESDSIRFTNYEDDYWKGIKIESNAQMQKFDYCVIEFSRDCGLFLQNAHAEMSNCYVRSNRVSFDGSFSAQAGGLTFIDSDVSIEKSIISGNELFEGGFPFESAAGAAFHGGIIIIDACIFCNNIDVPNYGTGGILSVDSDTHIDNCLFYGNYGHWGGAVCCQGNQLTLTNCTLTKNNASAGGAIFSSVSDPFIYNSILCDNTATGNGNELHNSCSSTGGSVYPTFLYCNFGMVDDGDFYFDTSDPDCATWIPYFLENVTVNYNGHNCDAYYNIQEDVDFADPENNNYQLAENSACIDAGSNSFVNYLYDLAGNQRIFSEEADSLVDIGAYEFIGYLSSCCNPAFSAFDLIKVYPNPTNGISTFTLNISQKQGVTLKIYSINGKEIATLLDQKRLAGEYSIRFDASDFEPGIYFYHLTVINKPETGKLIVIR